MKKVKTFNSHVGLARFLGEISEDPIAWLARYQVEDIPSPYAYSPVKAIYAWNDKAIVWFETRHKHYEVFEVPAEMTRFAESDLAETEQLAYNRKNKIPKLYH
jgi:hypothetical protein